MSPRGLGVCSWSLLPDSAEDLANKIRACDVDAVQLALDPIREGHWDLDQTRATLDGHGIRILSGMMTTVGEDYTSLESIRRTGGVVPDEHWLENLANARAVAAIAAKLGLELVTFHAGFIPGAGAAPSQRATIIDRLRRIADVFADHGLRLGLETGQETAACLLGALEEVDRANVGVNFDPANMVLYGMGDPCDALEAVADHVLQIHIKDALPSTTAGDWGTEVPVGVGFVDWERFLSILNQRGLLCDLVIERESGDRRIEDVKTAAALIRALQEPSA